MFLERNASIGRTNEAGIAKTGEVDTPRGSRTKFLRNGKVL